MNLEIDGFTPCLERTSDSVIVDTSYSAAILTELVTLKDWQFRWKLLDTKGIEIYKLNVADDDRIQGLVAIQNVPSDKAVYVKIAESAPHNIGKNKEYKGVGGHLFAIAIQRSIELGNDGFVYMDAKNLRLVSHYSKTLGATFIGTPHPYRMAIDEITAKQIISFYNFREELL